MSPNYPDYNHLFFVGDYKRLIIVLFEMFILIIFKPAAPFFSSHGKKGCRKMKVFDWLITQQVVSEVERSVFSALIWFSLHVVLLR